jgi:crossover junction endodeoxyribonuclease RuvC
MIFPMTFSRNSNSPLKVLGIDPGLNHVGWAVLTKDGNSFDTKLQDCGLIKTTNQFALPLRLEYIFREMNSLIERIVPSAIAIEEVFFMKRASTVSATIQARGVILLAGQLNQVPLTSYDPRSVKMKLCGNGNAPKAQMQRMTQLILKLKNPLTPDDVADAAAIALCHLKTAPLKTKIHNALKQEVLK